MAEEGHIPPRNNGRKETSAPMEYGTPSEILPVEMTFNIPLFPCLFTFTSILIIFWLFEQALLQWLFQYLFKPKGAGTFFYSFKFYGGKFRLCCAITIKRLLPSVDGPHQGLKLIQVHKVDGPHQGSRPQSTKWADPTRVSNLYKSTKWTDSTKGQDPNP